MAVLTRHVSFAPLRSACLVASFIAVAGCGGEPKAPASDTATAPPAVAPAPAPTTTPATTPAAPPAPAAAISGKTHDVQMVGDATGYRFIPASVTIKPGDGIRWTMVTGGPHNVSFWADSIPKGAGGVLNGAMARQISPLAGALLMQPNETYTISFAGAPKGTYHYFCTPHLAMKMVGTITVQ